MRKIDNITLTQYYKGLNNRFDNRIKKLIKLGYLYFKEEVQFKVRPSQIYGISNSQVMHMDKRAWNNLFTNNRV